MCELFAAVPVERCGHCLWYKPDTMLCMRPCPTEDIPGCTFPLEAKMPESGACCHYAAQEDPDDSLVVMEHAHGGDGDA